MDFWPQTPEALVELQERLRRTSTTPQPGRILDRTLVAGFFVCFERGKQGQGKEGDRGWAGVSLFRGPRFLGRWATEGVAGYRYEPGLLALREGPLLVRAFELLDARPDLLVINATGLDHPRRAGLALHAGAAFGIPSIGVTSRPLCAQGSLPPDELHAASFLMLEGEKVAAYLRTRKGARPVVIHPGFSTDMDFALRVAEYYSGRFVTPLPLREARRAARTLRSRSQGRIP